MRKVRSPSLIVALLAVVLAVIVAGVASGGTAQTGAAIQTFHVLSGRVHEETLDLGPRGKSPGDVYVFDATVLSTNGRTVLGRLRGTQTDIKLEHRSETVQGLLTFELGAGNQIVVGGLSAYPLNGRFLISGKIYVRAVLGGTGRYAGAKGTLTTRPLPGGRYDQVFRLTY